jgi:hypothetical protein
VAQIYELVLDKDTVEFPKGSRYIGQHNGNTRNYFTSGTIPKQIIKEFGKSAFSRSVIVEGNFNKELLNALEKHYIRLYNTYNNGLNLSAGGSMTKKGPACKRVYQYTLGGELIKGYKGSIVADKITGVSSKAIGACARGKSKSAGGFIWAYLKANNIGAYSYKFRKVFQYDLDGNFVREFADVDDACKLYSLDRNAVMKVCSQEKCVLAEFQWRYYYRNKIRRTAGPHGRKVYQLSTEGCLLNTYESVAEASAKTHLHSSGICNVLNGKYKNTGGFIWVYNFQLTNNTNV